jgi:hypothetical protein
LESFLDQWDAGDRPSISRRYSIMKKPKSLPVRSDRPGRAAGRRAQGVQDAGAPSRTQSASNARATSPAKSRTGRAGVDWRYLTPDQWGTVARALKHYQSTFVDQFTRDLIGETHDELARQEPTV